MKKRIGIDIGGTAIKAALVEEGRVIDFKREETPADGETGIMLMKKMVEAWLEVTEEIVGAAAPGPLDTKSGVFHDPPNLPGWHGFALRDRLSEVLGRACLVENDANAAAAGEFTAGAGKGYGSIVYITISTGVGAGIIVGNALLSGAQSIAGEVGNLIIADQGPYQEGMNSGSWESLASGTALGKAAEEKGIHGGAEKLFTLLKEGDRDAERIFEIWLDYTARGIANVIHTINPEAVILGGGVMNEADFIIPRLMPVVREKVYASLREQVVILPALLGAHVGVVGAAGLGSLSRI
ncbi:ROK family protein [Alkalicoccus halolimnae]|uniref:ROK family protein n=1 Tax=Alkalicoccus halolimnae TaxID=1667239 RepID=A0AAJ8LVK1_9BACI|nr:ROK family protein [Alkalicoccus halolimnae]